MCHKIIMHVITDKVSHLRVDNNIFHKTIELLFKVSLPV